MAGVVTTPAGVRRVALLGPAVRAERLLIPGLLTADNCALTVLCSRSVEKAQDDAARHGAALDLRNGVRALLCGDQGSIEPTLDADTALVQAATVGQPFAPRTIDDDLEVSYTAFPAVQMQALVASLDGTQQFLTVQEALEVQALQDDIARRAGLEPASLAVIGR
jgi:hypothetical protein